MPVCRRHGEAEHNRQFLSFLCHHLSGCIHCNLRIQRIEDGLNQNSVYPTVDQCFHLFQISIIENTFGKGLTSSSGHRTRTTSRSYATHHEPGLVWILTGILISQFTSNPTGLQVDLTTMGLQTIVAHGDGLCIKGIGLDEIGSCVKVFPMDLTQHKRTGERQYIITPLQFIRMLYKTCPTEVLLSQMIALNHRTHSTIQHQYPLLSHLFQ